MHAKPDESQQPSAQAAEGESAKLPKSGRAGADLCQGDERRALWAQSGVTA